MVRTLVSTETSLQTEKCIQETNSQLLIRLCLLEHEFVSLTLAPDRLLFSRVNDRGPFIGAREFDLSRYAAQTLGLISAGVATLQFEIL